LQKDPKTEHMLKEHHVEGVLAAHDLLVKNQLTHISIQELSKLVRLDRTVLQAGFKQLFEISIYDFLVQRRMQKGEELLSTTTKDIKSISFLCGYKRHSSFSKAFQKSTGLTPTAYREQQLNGKRDVVVVMK
jgi:AraC-like DNA-binding protein